MLVRAVTKTWQDSLDGPPSIGRVYQPNRAERMSPTSAIGWCRPAMTHGAHYVANDDGDDDPAINPVKRNDFVPMRRGVPGPKEPSDSFRTSHQFWMGIVVGAGIVFVIKTVLSVQAPFGVTWY